MQLIFTFSQLRSFFMPWEFANVTCGNKSHTTRKLYKQILFFRLSAMISSTLCSYLSSSSEAWSGRVESLNAAVTKPDSVVSLSSLPSSSLLPWQTKDYQRYSCCINSHAISYTSRSWQMNFKHVTNLFGSGCPLVRMKRLCNGSLFTWREFCLRSCLRYRVLWHTCAKQRGLRWRRAQLFALAGSSIWAQTQKCHKRILYINTISRSSRRNVFSLRDLRLS